jgi:hypothetical protein
MQQSNPTNITPDEYAANLRGYGEGVEAAERRIVEWLRERNGDRPIYGAGQLADMIERGDHRG